MDPSARIIGPGRAGGSFALALESVGWTVEMPTRSASSADAAVDVDLVLLCVPDAVVEEVAAQIEPSTRSVVAHCAGALTLDVLGAHPRRASLHPLVSLTSAAVGAERLRSGAWFAVAGDPLVRRVVADLGGRVVEPPERRRVEYHAAAVVASNHLVALMGQVERIAADVGVPLEAFLDLAAGSLAGVGDVGAAAALTGPVARGDWATVGAHVMALAPEEREAYVALARAAARLIGVEPPELPWPP